MTFRSSLILALLALILPPTGRADTQSMAPYSQPPMDWQTVTNWHADPETAPALKNTMATIVTLAPGQGIWFLADSGSYVRVDTQTSAKGLVIRQGGALGLFQSLPMTPTPGGKTLVSQRTLSGNVFVWVRNNGKDPVTLTAKRTLSAEVPFVSDWPEAPTTGLEPEWLKRSPQSAWQKHYRLGDAPVTFTAEGPMLMKLKVRRSLRESPPERRDTLTVRLDDEAPEQHLLHFSPQRTHRYWNSNQDILLSLPESVLIQIPEGQHQVQLQSTSPGWFQPRRLDNHHLLASEKNSWLTDTEEVAPFLLDNYRQQQIRLKNIAYGQADTALALSEALPVPGSPAWPADVGHQTLFDRYTQNRSLWPAMALPEQRWQPVTARLEHSRSDTSRVEVEDNRPSAYQHFFALQPSATTLEMPVPETRHPSELRILLARAQPGTRFDIEAGPRHFSLVYEPRIAKPELTRPDPSKRQALARGLTNNPVLAAEADLVVPEGVRHIRLRTLNGTGWINLQLREPVHPALTEAEFLAALRLHGHSETSLAWRQASRPPGVSLPLWHDAEFLRRWLHSRADRFVNDLAEPLYNQPPPREASRILSNLIKSGKSDLAENYARGILAFRPDSGFGDPELKTLREQAFNYLFAEFNHRSSSFSLQTLLAFTYLNRNNQPDITLALAEELLAEGQAGPAIRLVLSLPPEPLNTDQRARRQLAGLRASRASNWQRSYSRFYQKLSNGHEASRVIGQTGPKQWRDWPLGYNSPVQRETLYNPDLDRFYQRLKLKPQTPATLTVTGPAKLRLGLNLLHEDRSARLTDTIHLTHNGDLYLIPLLNSAVYNAHQLLSTKSLSPGTETAVTLELGPGQHQLSVAPSQHLMLANWQIEAPETLPAPYIAQQPGLVRHCRADRQRFESNRARRLAENTGSFTTLTPDYELPGEWLAQPDSGNNSVAPCALPTPTPPQPQLSGPLLSLDPPAVADRPSKGPASAAARLSQILLIENFASQPALVAEANNLAYQFPDNEQIQSLIERINGDQFWVQEEIIVSSAGLQSFDSGDWPPESDFLGDRMALLGLEPETGEFLVFGRSPEGILINNQEPQSYSLQLRLAKPAYQAVPPVTVLVKDGKTVVRRATLSQDQPRSRLRFSVPEGQHRLSLALENPTSRHWVFARLRYRPDGAPESGWQTAVPEQRRFYHWVTRQEPMVAYIDQPSWMRIETYDGHLWQSRYHYQPRAGNFTLTQQVANAPWVRLFSLRHRPERERLDRVHQPPPIPALASQPRYQATTSPSFVMLHDALASRPENAGTPGGFFSLRQRPDFDSVEDDQERFLEAGFRYRAFRENSNLYWQSDVFARGHSSGGVGVLGTRQWLSWRPELRNWRAGLYGTSHWQIAGSGEKPQGSALLEARFDGYMPLGHDVTWEHEIKSFGRWLSKDQTTTNYRDNDVFSRYKNDHRHGIAWEESLRFQPFGDTRWIGGLGFSTNEDLNPFEPDRFHTRLSWQQYYVGGRYEASIERRWLQADDDRSQKRSQTLFNLSANWYRWKAFGTRWELAGQLGVDLNNEQLSATITISRDAPGARRLRDFRPEQFVFPRRQYIHAVNQVHHNQLNHVEEE